MQIAKVSSDTIRKLAFAPAREQTRDGLAIAKALEASASMKFGLDVLTLPDGENGYIVSCAGRPGKDGKPIVDITYRIPCYGAMEARVHRGMTQDDGAWKLMNYIVAEAVRTAGIRGLQFNTEVNVYAIANRDAAPQSQPVQVPNGEINE